MLHQFYKFLSGEGWSMLAVYASHRAASLCMTINGFVSAVGVRCIVGEYVQ